MIKLRKISAGITAAAMLLCSGGCTLKKSGEQTGEQTPAVSTTTTEITTTTTTTAPPPPPPDIRVSMVAAGDNLVQSYVLKAAQAESADGSYNFDPLYANIKPIVQGADVAVINQETLICGGDYEITGAKLNFNSPVELGEDMVELGFDVFTVANNHMLDKRIDGLESSMDYWDGMMEKYPILALGAYRNEEDQNRIRIQEVNGMTIAYLACTEHLNGYSIPAKSQVKVGMTSDTALMQRQIREAKNLADAVVVAAHWGTEDTNATDQDVKDLAAEMIEWGADVILGTHPHTAQTMEYITRKDGSEGFVYYSLGNLISNQTDNFNVVGEIGSFELVKNGTTGAVTVENVGCIPVITHYGANYAKLRLYPYSMYTAELAAAHALPYTHAYPEKAKDFGMAVIDRIIEKNIPEEFRILN